MAARNNRRRRNRYRELESRMSKILIADGLIFLLYMFAASRANMGTVKLITAIVSIVITVLSLAWLFLMKEIGKRRSLWMVTACISILTCLLVSLCLNYPCPPLAG